VISSLAGAEIMTSAKPLTILVNSYTGLIDYAFTDWYFVALQQLDGIITINQPCLEVGQMLINTNLLILQSRCF
jgi:hypothetical protein